jgi:CBS domain-containing protein
MKARDVMTTAVVSVRLDTPTREIAKLLSDKGISAVPVLDSAGAPVGMISEGDLIGRDEAAREARRDWWLSLLAEGGALAEEFLASLRATERTARDVMAAPVVAVDEETDAAAIARLLTTYRIKRVPVLRQGRLVGIVSRADLLRAIAEAPSAQQAAPRPGFLSNAIAGLEERFKNHERATAHEEAKPVAAAEPALKVSDFRGLVADHEHKESEHIEEARRRAAEARRRKVEELVDTHASDESWRSLLHQARRAAEQGLKELMLLRFPSQLCSDGGRAVNVAEAGWPATLRGEAAELYLRWENELKPRGFHLAARVVDFPGGMPGDIGLFLVWGE